MHTISSTYLLDTLFHIPIIGFLAHKIQQNRESNSFLSRHLSFHPSVTVLKINQYLKTEKYCKLYLTSYFLYVSI